MRHGRGMVARWLAGLALTLAVAAGLPAPAGARGDEAAAALPASGPWRGVAVTDTQGWTLRDVTLRLAADGRALVLVRADGAEKTLAFADLAEVRDAEGRDITDGILALAPGGAAAAAAADAPAPNADPEFGIAPPATAGGRPRGRGREAPVFGAAFDVGIGKAVLMGDWFWGGDNGGFAQAGVRFGTSGRHYVHLVFRSQSMGSATYSYYGEAPVRIDYTMRSYQVLAGLLEERLGRRGVRTRAYVEGGGGLMEIAAHSRTGDDSVTRFAFAVQTGAWIHVGGDLAVDVGLHGFYKPGWLNDEAGGASAGVHVGLVLVR